MSQMGSIAPWGENEPGYFAMMEISTNKKIIPKIVLEENTWGEETCSRKNSDGHLNFSLNMSLPPMCSPLGLS